MNVQKLVLIFFVLSLFVTKSYGFGEIVITEIMADPSPVVGLPESEYIELYNNTDRRVSLVNYKLYYGDKPFALPDSIINPGQYAILVPPASKGLFDPDINIVSVQGFPALSNQGKLLYIEDNSGKNIFSLEYADTWYKSSFKKQGGWSLECIDRFNYSGKSNNWTASVSKNGGSPGNENSVNAINTDISLPAIERLFIIDSKSVQLTFSCIMSEENIEKVYNYLFQGGNNIVTRAKSVNKLCNSVTLYLSDDLTNTKYHLKIGGLISVNGISIKDTVLVFSLPLKPESADISINEIMFNPTNEGSDFVEIVNISEKCLDLSDIYLTNIKEDGSFSEGYRLSDKSYPFMPGTYIILSEKVDSVFNASGYMKSANSIELSGFPSMPDDIGNVIIAGKNAEIIDRVDYNKNMHMPLLSEIEGVSLEKINPAAGSGDEKSWTSASYTANYSTPGFKNSQFKELNLSVSDDFIVSEKKWFTPDNDGNDDILELTVKNTYNGIAEITVYNLSGRLVNVLVNKKLLSSSDTIYWDGKDSYGNIVKKGRYIINAILISGDGNILNKRFSVSVL